MICIALAAETLDEDRKALVTYREWVRAAELRVDRLRKDQIEGTAAFISQSFENFKVPFILTIRTIEDGGSWAWGEDERRRTLIAILGAVANRSVEYVDLEGSVDWPDVELAARARGVGIIRSYHNHAGTPADLADLAMGLYRHPGELAKVAVMARGIADVATIFRAAARVKESGRPFILLGMGPFGVPTRILSGLMGCRFTYASAALPGHVPAAPGHMDPQMLAEQFGYYQIKKDTRIFGIIGNPVMHSRSPAYHNPRFRASGLDAVYVPFQADDLPAFFSLANEIGIKGLSVTIPHKEAVVHYLGSSDPSVDQVGACNTMLRRNDAWFGTNTDAPGFYLPLEELLRNHQGQRPTAACVVGSGGSARAVVQALLAHGFRVLILNRSQERAQALAQDFRKWYPAQIEAGGLPGPDRDEDTISQTLDLMRAYTEIIVQTTSMGMEGDAEGQDPLPFYQFSGHEVVYDIIYTPPLTPLLKRAQESGCRIVNGWPMFEQQALLQSELFIASMR